MSGLSPAAYSHIDRSGMLPLVLSYFRDLRAAVASASELNLRVRVPEPLRGIVVTGMGGSFIGALFLQDALYDRLRVPIYAVREMSLPAFVDEHHLVIAVSYSGNTEETIRVVAEALRRRAPTIAVTSGGLLGDHFQRLGYPLIRLPPGLPPRAAFPFMLPALAAAIEAVDASIGLLRAILEAASYLEGASGDLQRTASDLADWLHGNYSAGRLPVIYAYRPYLSAGYRFKTQINENSKLHAFFSEIPESNHNEIMGWESPSSLCTIAIRASSEPPELLYRLDFLTSLWRERGVPHREVRPLGRNRVEELLSLFYAFDLASVLLALKRAVDPTPVGTISELKKYLDARIDLRSLLPRAA